jgi:hypothetical protein
MWSTDGRIFAGILVVLACAFIGVLAATFSHRVMELGWVGLRLTDRKRGDELGEDPAKMVQDLGIMDDVQEVQTMYNARDRMTPGSSSARLSESHSEKRKIKNLFKK